MLSKKTLTVTIVVVACVAGAAALSLVFKGGAPPERTVLAILPLTGEAASLGEYARDGVLLYQRQNPDSLLTIDLTDSETTPAKAVSVLQQKVLTAKPNVVISSLSMVSGAVIPKAKEYDLFVIGILTSSEKISIGQTNFQRINDRAVDISQPLAEYVRTRLRTAAVLYSDEDFGLACKQSFVTTFADATHTITRAEPYNLKDPNVRISVQRVAQGKPDAIFVAGYGPAYISIFKTLREYGFAGQVMAEINFSNPEVLESLGEAGEGIVFTGLEMSLTEPRQPRVREFVTNYRESFRRDPWIGAAYAYDALALIEHMERAGTPITQEAFREIGEWRGIAGNVSFIGAGECQYSFHVMQRTRGKNVLVDNAPRGRE